MNRMKNKIIWKAFRELFTASKTMFLLSYIFTMIQGVSRIFPIIALQQLFDHIAGMPGKDGMPDVVKSLLLFVGARVLCHIIDLIVNYLYEYYDLIAGAGMKNNVNRKISEVPAIEFEKTEFLEKMNKAYRGTNSIRRFIDTWMMILLLYLPEMVVIAAYLYRANPYLPLLLLLIAIPAGVIIHLQEKEFGTQEEQIANTQRKIDIYHTLLFGIRNIIETKVCGYEPMLMGHAKECICKKAAEKYKYGRKKNNFETLEKGITTAGYFIVFAVLIWCAKQNMITLGTFAALVTFLEELFTMMEEVLSILAEGVSEELEKIRNYFKITGEIDWKDRKKGDTISDVKEIKLEHVDFSYPGAERKALEDVSFTVKKGEHIAIVGANGSGKSTLVKLLCGIYECTNGEVKVNGKNINDYSRQSLYSKFTAVFQNFGKYALTRDENIILAEKENEAKRSDILHLEGMEGLHKIPQDEVLSREFGGTDISGGQWQRIAIARARYRDGEVYLLDEPTSAIDPNEERTFYELFMQMMEGKMSFLVTHRMGAARLAEKIIVMQGGRICAFGTHEQLYGTCEEYQKLWDAQADAY